MAELSGIGHVFDRRNASMRAMIRLHPRNRVNRASSAGVTVWLTIFNIPPLASNLYFTFQGGVGLIPSCRSPLGKLMVRCGSEHGDLRAAVSVFCPAQRRLTLHFASSSDRRIPRSPRSRPQPKGWSSITSLHRRDVVLATGFAIAAERAILSPGNGPRLKRSCALVCGFSRHDRGYRSAKSRGLPHCRKSSQP